MNNYRTLALLIALYIQNGIVAEEYKQDEYVVSSWPRLGKLELKNDTGEIIVKHVDKGNELKIEITKKALSKKELDLLLVDAVSMKLDEKKGEAKIKVEVPNICKNCKVDIHISMPPTKKLEIEQGTGGVDLRDIQGEIEAESGSGNVTIAQSSSNPDKISLKNGCGKVNITNASRKTEVKVGTGAISITQSDKAKDKIKAEIGSGSIIILNAMTDIEAEAGVGIVTIKKNKQHKGKIKAYSCLGTVANE